MSCKLNVLIVALKVSDGFCALLLKIQNFTMSTRKDYQR